MRVATFYDPPPIPMRQWDWSAYDVDEYEPGRPVGYGRTEDEAIADLKAKIEELNE